MEVTSYPDRISTDEIHVKLAWYAPCWYWLPFSRTFRGSTRRPSFDICHDLECCGWKTYSRASGRRVDVLLNIWKSMSTPTCNYCNVHLCSKWWYNPVSAMTHTDLMLLWSPYGIGQTIIFLPCGFFFLCFLPRLISAVGDWMSAILPHMVWPCANLGCRCETCCMVHAAHWKCRTQKIAICTPSYNFVGLYLRN